MNLRIEITDRASQEEVLTIIDGVVAYNDSRVGSENLRHLAVFLRDPGGSILGGLNGYTHWNWLFISHLWLGEEIRGRHLGRFLLKMAEDEAVRRGCEHSFLDTFDFQAREFYEKCGYVLFGVLEDYPTGHTHYFLQKHNLVRPSDVSVAQIRWCQYITLTCPP